MKNFLRNILSSKVLCFVLLFLEFFVVVAAWSFIEFRFVESASGGTTIGELTTLDIIIAIVFYSLRAILFLIDLFVFFKIILRDENPEYKIPWLVCMFILPIWTITFYLIFGRTKLRKKDAKIVAESHEILQNYKIKNEKENTSVLNEIDPQYQGIFKYLQNTTNLNITTGNRITYFKNGETFFPDLIESLKLAEKFIFIEFFIINDGIWWKKVLEILKEKAAKGVEIRVIYDDIGSSKTIPKNIIEELNKLGIKCNIFHPVRPVFSNVVNNRDHRKIVVVDHKLAYTGGMNLADEYANDLKRYGYWKDTMVKIEGKAITNLIITFLQNYDLTTFTTSNYDKFINGDYQQFNEKSFAFPFGDSPGAYNGNHTIGEQNYINLINSATKQIYISTPYLITSYPLTKALTSTARRGVEVNLIVPGIPDKKFPYWMAKSQFHLLLKAGVKLYTYTPGFNHEKQILVDDRICFVGTINFDFRSLTHNFECGVTFLDNPCLKEIKADFEEMISVSKLVPVDFKVKGFQRLMAAVLKIFRVLF